MTEERDRFVSFIVIAYNEEHTIRACLDAISSQANLGRHEIIVVDDGSTDRTAKIVTDLAEQRESIVLISRQNGGRGAARATGIAAARGSVIAMVDADICLPPRFLSECLPHLNEYDAVGGTAVPDGDVAYLCNRFSLNPLPTLSPITVAGSNGVYRSEIFRTIGFDSGLREGEDVAFNHELALHGFRSYCVPGLLVTHLANKSFLQSFRWLFQSGRGATRQFARYKEVRMPDLAYAGFLAMTLVSLLAPPSRRRVVKVILSAYVLAVSGLHVRGKFTFERQPSYIGRYVAAVLLNALFMCSYFAGRTIGLSDWTRSFPSARSRRRLQGWRSPRSSR